MRLKMDSSSVIWALNTTNKTGESSNFPELFQLEILCYNQNYYSHCLQLLPEVSPMDHFQMHLYFCTDYKRRQSWILSSIYIANV